MRAPAFWWRSEPTMAARLLAPVAHMVGRRAARRLAAPGVSAALPVICVGNPVVGGAGKTPTALALGEIATAMGLLPAFLTRGYGGALAGPVLVRAQHGAADVGDEALLLAAVGPTVVARRRPDGAALAAETGADILIMDDGFQNPSLTKDAALLVVDGEVGVGNGLVMPAGPLRAPLGAPLGRAHAMVVVGAGEAGEAAAGAAAARGLGIHRAALVPDPLIAARLAGRRVIAFAGIGRPEKFAGTLHDLGATIERLITYDDHHALTEAEADRLLREAGNLDLVTTAKDFARLAGRHAPAYTALMRRAMIVPVSLVFDDPSALAALIDQVRRSRQATA
jgi:tetraacyldisaccharide 4'-kinase